jgi:hypothetical protein
MQMCEIAQTQLRARFRLNYFYVSFTQAAGSNVDNAANEPQFCPRPGDGSTIFNVTSRAE